ILVILRIKVIYAGGIKANLEELLVFFRFSDRGASVVEAFAQEMNETNNFSLAGQKDQDASFGKSCVDLHNLFVGVSHVIVERGVSVEVDGHGELSRANFDHWRLHRGEHSLIRHEI